MKKFVCVFCLIAIVAGKCFASADKDGPKIGDTPPPLKLAKTLQGPAATDLSWEQFRGKVVVLEFWATWCGPCIEAIPHVNDLVEQFKDKPVVFISVTSENEDVVKLFLKSHPMKPCIGVDDYEILNKAFHVQGIPHAVIVDATGHIAAIAHPAIIKREHLEEVLAGKKCSLPEPGVYTVSKSAVEVAPNQAPALYEISIRAHPLPANSHGPICMWELSPDGYNGKIATVESALGIVFDKSRSRMVVTGKLPEGYYDFTLRAPSNKFSELRSGFGSALRSTFDLDVRQSTREVPVLILTQVSTNTPAFRKVEKPGGGGETPGGFRLSGAKMKSIAGYLENVLGKPVLDETGLDGYYYIDMKWKLSEAEQLQRSMDPRVVQAILTKSNDWMSAVPMELKEGAALEKAKRFLAELAKPESEQFRPDPEAVADAARERLGLLLTPAQRPIAILEVSPALRDLAPARD